MFELILALFLVIAAFLWHAAVRIANLPPGPRPLRGVIGAALVGVMLLGIWRFIAETSIDGWPSAVLNVALIVLGLLSAVLMAAMLWFLEDAYYIALVKNPKFDEGEEHPEADSSSGAQASAASPDSRRP